MTQRSNWKKTKRIRFLDREVTTGRAGQGSGGSGISLKRGMGSLVPATFSQEQLVYRLPVPPPVVDIDPPLFEKLSVDNQIILWLDPELHTTSSEDRLTGIANRGPDRSNEEAVAFGNVDIALTLDTHWAYTSSFDNGHPAVFCTGAVGLSGTFGFSQNQTSIVTKNTSSFHFMCVVKPKQFPSEWGSPIYDTPFIMQVGNTDGNLQVTPEETFVLNWRQSNNARISGSHIPAVAEEVYVLDVWREEVDGPIYYAHEDTIFSISNSGANHWEIDIGENITYFGENNTLQANDESHFLGWVGDMIWFSGALSSSVRNEVVQALKDKYTGTYTPFATGTILSEEYNSWTYWDGFNRNTCFDWSSFNSEFFGSTFSFCVITQLKDVPKNDEYLFGKGIGSTFGGAALFYSASAGLTFKVDGDEIDSRRVLTTDDVNKVFIIHCVFSASNRVEMYIDGELQSSASNPDAIWDTVADSVTLGSDNGNLPDLISWRIIGMAHSTSSISAEQIATHVVDIKEQTTIIDFPDSSNNCLHRAGAWVPYNNPTYDRKGNLTGTFNAGWLATGSLAAPSFATASV